MKRVLLLFDRQPVTDPAEEMQLILRLLRGSNLGPRQIFIDGAKHSVDLMEVNFAPPASEALALDSETVGA